MSPLSFLRGGGVPVFLFSSDTYNINKLSITNTQMWIRKPLLTTIPSPSRLLMVRIRQSGRRRLPHRYGSRWRYCKRRPRCCCSDELANQTLSICLFPSFFVWDGIAFRERREGRKERKTGGRETGQTIEREIFVILSSIDRPIFKIERLSSCII